MFLRSEQFQGSAAACANPSLIWASGLKYTPFPTLQIAATASCGVFRSPTTTGIHSSRAFATSSRTFSGTLIVVRTIARTLSLPQNHAGSEAPPTIAPSHDPALD